MAWESDGQSCTLRIRPQSASPFLVEVIVHGAVVSSRRFSTRADAEQEAERLRKLFLDPLDKGY